MNNNINIIEDEPAALFDAKVAFIDRALEDGRLTVVNTIFAETNEDNQHNLIAKPPMFFLQHILFILACF